MAQTTTQIQIINRALQLLGARPISSIQENSPGARAMNVAYQPVLLNELRQNFWRFSIKRIMLAASATPPIFGPANYYPLPGDYLMLAPQDTNVNPNSTGPSIQGTTAPRDWQVENDGQGGLALVTNDPAPLRVRYVSSAVTEALFDVSFAEAFAGSLAMNTCEQLTQSNSKIATAQKFYETVMQQAQKRNCFEIPPMAPPIDSYILVRF